MHPEDWIPLWIGVAAGIVLGAAVIAYAFSRAMSRLKRVGAIALSLIVLAVCSAIGFWFVLLRAFSGPALPAT